ncbi:hypothetical protein [Lunatimonas salinarum]|uniref:hypothetical protein n=1 Tax=Lunatimonas salinarum TaxID=1774590 RepID=UPI001ADF6A88|nr:hypothetical protein [Lunatimonas salinarum]
MLFLIKPLILLGQIPASDSLYTQSYQEIRSFFPEVHTGSQYARSQTSIAGHPYFGNNAMEFGNIDIQGFKFSRIPLQFDIYDEILVTLTPAKGQRTILNPLRIQAFTLADGSRFVKKDQVPEFSFHRKGFYREISVGKQGLYCKHYKEIKKDSSPLNPYLSYLEVTRYFIEKENRMHLIRRKKDAYGVLSLNRKEIRPQLRESKLSFKRNKEAYLLLLVSTADRRSN